MKKRIISLFLLMVMACSLVPAAFAASEEAIGAAEQLYELGLFEGTGTDANGNPIFDLDRTPTRHEAVTMLVRLLGKEEEAKAGNWEIPFTDVAEWAKPYVGYAYANNLTSGTSSTTYSGNATVTASQYLTFVLRALGYDSSTDFRWDKAWELSDKLGITDGQYNATSAFTRGDVAIISYNALNAPKKETQLLEDNEIEKETDATDGCVVGKQYKTASGYGVTITQADVETIKGVKSLVLRYTLENLTEDQFLYERTFMFGFTDGTSSGQGGIYLDGMYPGEKLIKTFNLILEDKELSFIMFDEAIEEDADYNISEYEQIKESLARAAGKIPERYYDTRWVWYLE